jgi:DNA end-binding protein Ku
MKKKEVTMARRSIWKGAINFAMVSIPCKLYSATDELKISLHQYHRDCGSRISMPKFCPGCNKMLEAQDITKGYEVGEGYVPVSEADLQSLPLKSVKAIEVVDFLAADEVGHRAYKLFLMAMEKANLVAVAKLAYREREHLAVVRPYSGVMLLQTLHYADELRDYDDLRPREPLISQKEVELTTNLVKAMSVPQFELAKYHDEYREALEKLIEARIAGEVLPTVEAQPAPVSDVAEALIASLNLIQSRS